MTLEYLRDVSSGRDNNFNLIRMIAATAVLVSHAYPLTRGKGAAEPLVASLGHSLGGLAVYAFFVISGFLITASFINSRSWQRFVVARLLRLFPGLVVSLALVALIMGPLVTTLPLAAYLFDPGLPLFFAKNIALIKPEYTLPGVFETNPYPTVEGSIWTLFYEVVCYGGVFIAGMIGVLRRPRVMALLFGLYLAIWIGLRFHPIAMQYQLKMLIRMIMPFAIGMVFYIWRDKLPLTWWGIAGLAVLTWAIRDTVLYDIALILTLGYAVFWLAYIPGGAIRAYNRLGDYSYGMYIYAFPVQGLAVWLFGPMSPLENMAWSLPMTLIPSVLSWHLIEQPALRLRNRVGALLERPGKTHPRAW